MGREVLALTNICGAIHLTNLQIIVDTFSP